MAQQQTVPVNPVKARLEAGEAALGLNVRLSRSGDIARIAKATGHDFLFIDTQHSIFSLETLAQLIQAALGSGVAPLVRVRGVDDPDTALLLDNGAAGIVFPDVSTAAEARRAVELCRFAPRGRRSVAGGYPQFDFRAVPVGEATRLLDEATLVVCMIETPAGLEAIDEIAAVDGVDVLHLGSNDLMAALGKPGSFDDPVLTQAIGRVLAAARRHGKAAGCGGVRDVARQAALIREGMRFLTTQTDIGFLMAAAQRWTQELRALA